MERSSEVSGPTRCKVEQAYLENQSGNGRGKEILSVQATCLACGNMTSSYGTTSRSIGRCMALMRDTCPRGESNFYYDGTV